MQERNRQDREIGKWWLMSPKAAGKQQIPETVSPKAWEKTFGDATIAYPVAGPIIRRPKP